MTDKFDSGADKRVDNNPILPEDYSGPDDVSLRYCVLTDDDKKNMGNIKMLSQRLINEIRSLYPDVTSPPNVYLEEAIKNTQLASIWATKYITGPK